MPDALKDWIELVGGVIGLGTFIFGIFQYWQAQRWKTAEFVASKMDVFMNNPDNELAMLMLDWNKRTIAFHPQTPIHETSLFVIDDNLLYSALRTHIGPSDAFPRPQSYIRDVFDHFFDDLSHLYIFVQADLVTIEHLRPYLTYWLDILTGTRPAKPRKLVEQLWCYIDFYDFGNVRELCQAFGYINLPPKKTAAAGARVSPEINEVGAENMAGQTRISEENV
jgi:hypothetical protein